MAVETGTFKLTMTEIKLETIKTECENAIPKKFTKFKH